MGGWLNQGNKPEESTWKTQAKFTKLELEYGIISWFFSFIRCRCLPIHHLLVKSSSYPIHSPEHFPGSALDASLPCKIIAGFVEVASKQAADANLRFPPTFSERVLLSSIVHIAHKT
ncbi:hypothetical protein VTL71DRAFT_11943 [Oculimacula yallundae]|uniref:Uncharacterized protein n=1 Tax=Oculimacula yallundae TaxID=86028 RepID=A0ABR4CRL3_9HELO